MMNRRLRAPVLALGAGTALVLSACAGDGSSDDQGDRMATVTETATETVQTTLPQETETLTGAPSPTQDPEEITVPGEQVETFFSTAGQEVGVAGLAPDQEPLEVRAVPSSEGETVAEIDRLGAVELAGREWNNPALEDEGYWAEVLVDGQRGWMLSGNLYHFAGTSDVTDDYAGVPAADSAQAAAQAVAEDAAREADWILLTTPEYAGEPFYRVDVTGMRDDSVAGERLFITVGENNGRYEVDEVERTLICQRGVSGDLCV